MAIDYSKIPHEDVTDTYRYTNLPKQFFEYRAMGRMTPLMFDVLAWVWEHAGYMTGITKWVTAETILDDLFPVKVVPKKDRPSLSTIQRVLRQLEDLGYITLPTKYKHRRNYSIIANGYVVLVDGRKLSLRPKEIKAYGDRDDEFDAPDEAPSEEPVTLPCGTDAGPVTLPCGTDDATTSGITGKSGSTGVVGGAGIAPNNKQQPPASPEKVAAVVSSGETLIQEPKTVEPEIEPAWVEKDGVMMGWRFARILDGYKPEFLEPPSSSLTWELFLARYFHHLLGRPAKHDPRKWEEDFKELLSAYPDLSELLDFAFLNETTGKWRDQLKGVKIPVNSPVGLLRVLLPSIEDAYRRYCEKLESAGGVEALLASGKTYERDGNTFKFVNSKEHGPCWCRVDDKGLVSVPWADAVGLDVPFPEDALEYAG